MLFSLPLAFAQHLDARTVDQMVQFRCCRLGADCHRKMLLTPANGTEVGHLPVQASKLEQALRHAHRLAQSQVEQALDRQAELDCRLALLRAAATLAASNAVPAHALVQPDEQGATCLPRRVVAFPISRSVLRFYWGTHAVSLPRTYYRPVHRRICATKPCRDGGHSTEASAFDVGCRAKIIEVRQTTDSLCGLGKVTISEWRALLDQTSAIQSRCVARAVT